MIPFDDLVTRWQTYSAVPVYVGTVPEGTLPPYASINLVQSNQVTLTKNANLWTESLVQISATTEKLADNEQLAQVAIQAYDKQTFLDVVDMVLINRSTSYSDQPNLTGNRAWTAALEFRIRH